MHIRMLQSGVDAARLSVRLCPDQAGKRVAGRTSNALALLWIALVEPNAERDVEGMQSKALEVIMELLNAGLVAHGRVGVGRGRPRLGRIGAALSVDVIHLLRLRV